MIVTLDRFILKQLLTGVFVSLSFFVLLLHVIELFANIGRYLSLEIPAAAVLRVQLLYLPKSISLALPLSVLFGVSYTLGIMYSRNELISVFAGGMSLRRFVAPVLVAGALLSVLGFLFEEGVVIESYRRKNTLQRELLQAHRDFSNPDVAVLGDANRVVYIADFYNADRRTLSGLLVVVRNRAGELEERIDAASAQWTGEYWEFSEAKRYLRAGDDGRRFEREEHERYSDPRFDTPPRVFARVTRNVGEMPLDEAHDWVESLREAGLPYRRQASELYERYAFATTPFLMALFATGVGSRLRKNVLLGSLLTSVSLGVVYYVARMVLNLLAVSGSVEPLWGAWAPVLVFLGLGVLMFRHART